MRSIYLTLALFSLSLFLGAQQQGIESLLKPELKPFYFGVASGDPWPNSIQLWTKLLPSTKEDSIYVRWEIAMDTTMSAVIQRGAIWAIAQNDYSAKPVVEGLTPGSTYFYRFWVGNTPSPIGRTKTASTQSHLARFAVVSCSNYEQGYFNVYREIVEKSPDLVIHLGDYIYEYKSKEYGDTTVMRHHLPRHEIVSLDDYRLRYDQYHTDEDLIDLRRLFPIVTIWDDHEFANNAYKEGAQNHNPNTEGNWAERLRNAKKAYFENLPIRGDWKDPIYRSFSYGNLLDLFMLDSRIDGRDKQASNFEDQAFTDSTRSILSIEQEEWLKENLKSSTAKWKIVGNQVIFSPITPGKMSKNGSLMMDTWNGYSHARDKLMGWMEEKIGQNMIVLTGDYHSTWAFELTTDPTDKKHYLHRKGRGSFGAEFVVPSVTSKTPAYYVGYFKANLAEIYMQKTNRNLQYNDYRKHGFMLLTVTPEWIQGDYYHVKTIRKKSEKVSHSKGLKMLDGNGKLMKRERPAKIRDLDE